MTSETDGPGAPDPVQRLEGSMRERFGPDIAVQGPAETNTEGFDSEIHFLSLVGADVPEGWRAPLVLRIKPSAELSVLADREQDIQNWCADAACRSRGCSRCSSPATRSGRIALWKPVQLLHGWSQALGVQDDLFAPTGTAGEQRVPDSLANTLRSRFEQALAEVT